MKPSSLVYVFAGVLVSNVSAQDYKIQGFYGNLANQGYIGCFKEKGDFKQAGSDDFMTNSVCLNICTKGGKKYAGTSKNGQCWCGNTLPAPDDILDNDECSNHCFGWEWEPCGGPKGQLTITVGANKDDPRLYDGDDDGENGVDESDKAAISSSTATSTSSSTTPPAASTVVQEGKTITITPTAETNKPEEEDDNDGGLNKAGLAAGVVVGVLVAISAGVGAFLFVRRRKQQRVEDEYRRSLAVMEYGVKKPDQDMRLDPVMLQRRMSDGSIADNQDYSRRILKVTNPDGN